MSKLNVAVIFGGKSGEHEVSLTSAKNIISALDKEKYDLHLLGIDKDGAWEYLDRKSFLLDEDSVKSVKLKKSGIQGFISPSTNDKGLLIVENGKTRRQKIDVIIPVLHGPFGEDGTIQGLFEMASIPYVGCDVLGSSVGMDKEVMKRLFIEAGIPTAKYRAFHKVGFDKGEVSFKDVKNLGLPLFIKPANLGSSVGIHKVKDEASFIPALEDAFKYDTKVIVEETIVGREIECAVLGNSEPKSSVPGEIIPTHEFYSYDAKYIDADGAKLEAPANIPEDKVKEVQKLAIEVFKVLCAKGLGRVDFFLTEDGKFLCNEINTFPGFTKISMYPKLWDLSGLKYSDLLDELINLAIERFKEKSKNAV